MSVIVTVTVAGTVMTGTDVPMLPSLLLRYGPLPSLHRQTVVRPVQTVGLQLPPLMTMMMVMVTHDVALYCCDTGGLYFSKYVQSSDDEGMVYLIVFYLIGILQNCKRFHRNDDVTLWKT